MKNTGIEKSEIFNFTSTINYEEGGIVSKIIVKNTGGNVTQFAFDKGTQLSEHTAPFDALIQVIDGTAKIIIDKTPFELKQGDCIIMPADIPHAVEAQAKFKMILTMVK